VGMGGSKTNLCGQSTLLNQRLPVFVLGLGLGFLVTIIFKKILG